MKAEDFKQPGERAKRLLRVAQALTVLSKSKAPSLNQVNETITPLKVRQPAVAMALLFEYAKRQPLHKRLDWLNATQDALEEYRLSEDADKDAASRVSEYLEQEVELCEAEIEKQEKIRERVSMIFLVIATVLILGMLSFVAYRFKQKNESGNKKPETAVSEKTSSAENTVSEKTASEEKANETKSAQDKPARKLPRSGK